MTKPSDRVHGGGTRSLGVLDRAAERRGSNSAARGRGDGSGVQARARPGRERWRSGLGEFLLAALLGDLGMGLGVLVEEGRLVEGQVAGEDLLDAALVDLLGPGADQDGRYGVAREVGE